MRCHIKTFETPASFPDGFGSVQLLAAAMCAPVMTSFILSLYFAHILKIEEMTGPSLI